ncbi:MAG: DUF4351 domain-containing protein, partial [Polyangiaceae bacterium]|nr:DUF4351 domain-containing protein [Polyangiaceae bacterium]
LSSDPEIARLAHERAEAEYFYELALKKERELGEAAGEARGKAEGKAETVLKLIQLKFGPPSEAVQQRVRSASLGQLDRLAEKVILSNKLEELLGE